MNLGDRERRLVMILFGVLLVAGAYLFLSGGDDAVMVQDVRPTPAASVATSGTPAPQAFIIPPGARDPFKG